jgi:hypothetical protein
VTGQVKEGWYEDPSDHHEYRWFSNGTPTDLVKDGTLTSRDPISITESAAFESMELDQPRVPPPVRRRRGPGAAEVLVVLLLVLIGLALIRHNLRAGLIALLAAPVLVFIWLLWRRSQSRRRAHGGAGYGWWALAVVVAVYLGGLGWAYYWWTTSPGVPAGPASYLFVARTRLVFVQWDQPTSSGAVTGTITLAGLVGKPPEEFLEVASQPFTGQISSGSHNYLLGWPSISLASGGDPGTFQNGKLVLSISGPAGFDDSTYVLGRSDSAAYNAALRALTAQKQRANESAAAHR